MALRDAGKSAGKTGGGGFAAGPGRRRGGNRARRFERQKFGIGSHTVNLGIPPRRKRRLFYRRGGLHKPYTLPVSDRQ